MTKLLTILFIAWTAINWSFNCFQIPNQNDPCSVQVFNGSQELETKSIINYWQGVWYWSVWIEGEYLTTIKSKQSYE